MNTHNVCIHMVLWRNQKNILWIPPLIWNYGYTSDSENLTRQTFPKVDQ